jgi:predicted Zn-dependent protease with MMP-like domain
VTSAGRRERVAALRRRQGLYRPSRHQFERLVLEAVAELPREFRERIDNVAIVVEDWPQHVESDSSLLGLYQGTPIGERGQGYHLVPPDRIVIYRRPILALCATRADVVREIRDTVRHEVGHHFGLPESDLP